MARTARCGPIFIVNTAAEGAQGSPDVAALGDGRFVVVWDDDGCGVAAASGRVFSMPGPGRRHFIVNSGSLGYKFDPVIEVF